MTHEQEFELYYENTRRSYGSVKANPKKFAKEMFKENCAIDTRYPTPNK